MTSAVAEPVAQREVLQGELMPAVSVNGASPAPKNELANIAQSNHLDFESARSLEAAFSGFFDQAEKWIATAKAIQVTDISQTREMKLARETRLALRGIRIEAEKKRKDLKEDSLRRGKAIDGAANILKFLIEPIEKDLQEKEDFVARKEAERLALLQEERAAQLSQYEEPSTAGVGDLSRLTDEQFSALLDGTKSRFEARQAEARRVEEERVQREQAEAAERERIRLENERLRAEAEAAEAARAEQERVHQEQLRAEREKIEEEARLQRKEAERIANAKLAKQRAKLRAEQEARAAAELAAQQERDRLVAIEAERVRVEQEQAEAEAARIAAEEEAQRRAAAAPDKEKLCFLAIEVRALPVPSAMSTQPAHAVIQEYTQRVEELALWLESQAEQL